MEKNNIIGETIKRNRIHAGMTTKELGDKSYLPERSADIRICQYEKGNRVPSPKITEKIADALGISKYAISPLDISTDESMFYTLIRIMDMYDVRIGKLGENFCLLFPNTNNRVAHYFTFLYNANKLYIEGKITADDYMFIMDGVDIHKGKEYMKGVASLKRKTPRNFNTDFYELLSVVIPNDESFLINALSTLKKMLSDNMAELENSKTLLLGKMLVEQDRWLDELKTKSPDDIIKMANVICIREQIINVIDDDNFLSLKQIQSLYEMNTPLEACYEFWKINVDTANNNAFFEEVIKECANCDGIIIVE